MAYYTDYQNSKKKELEFEHYIKHEYHCLTENSQEKGRFPDWDVSTTAKTGAILKYEIKYNATYHDKDFKNGTVVIETAKIIDSISIPCGLSLTKADYYVLTFENDNNFYLIPVQLLKNLCDNQKIRQKKIIYDKGNYQIHVFDKPFLLSNCIVI